MWRFQARKTDDGFAVWDTHLSGWRSVQGLTETEAWQQASDLDILYDATGQRDPRHVRLLNEDPVPVDLAVWRPAGVLDAWVREDGTWWGRIRDDTGRIHWHPAGDLRRAQLDRPAQPSAPPTEPHRPVDPVGRVDPPTPHPQPETLTLRDPQIHARQPHLTQPVSTASTGPSAQRRRNAHPTFISDA